MTASLVLSNALSTQYFLKEETITFCDNSDKDKVLDFYKRVSHNRMSNTQLNKFGSASKTN